VPIGYRIPRTREEYEKRRALQNTQHSTSSSTQAPRMDSSSSPHSTVSTKSSQVPHTQGPQTQAPETGPTYPPRLTTSDSDDDDDDDGDSDRSTSTDSAVNYATQRDVHANNLRMERIKIDDDGRTHPDYPDRIEPGIPADIILCGNGRALNQVVTLAMANEWAGEYREMEDKDIVWHLPDPASIPID
jgi:hypothetical protein